ncbi:MAG: hypothetical protein M1822_000031 [Bathelium mastoideum]|nr:MAG: hypothetical protein M1822_000031 [Bathelium mastoideum]
MPYPLPLPTTSSLSLSNHFSSPTHPSLPYTASAHRSLLRSLLKAHRRLPSPQKPSHLPSIQSAIQTYLPCLLAIEAGLSGKAVSGEHIDVVLLRELTCERRPTLTSPVLPGRAPRRTPVVGLDAEIAFVLSTLAAVHTLLARDALRNVGRAGVASVDKTTAVAKAMKELLEAHAIHAFLASRAQQTARVPMPLDITFAVQAALASLALAEATLLPVVKEDPYPGALAEERSRTSTEWMVGTVKMASVRAGLFARLCIMAGEHAGRAVGLLGHGGEEVGGDGAKVDEGLVRYAQDLRRTARAKACRFLGVDAEGRGNAGEGIGWLRGAKRELGVWKGAKGDEQNKNRGLAKLKREWTEKREDRKIEKGGEEWGLDGGKAEEERVVDWLDEKWSKTNDTMTVQTVPPHDFLLASLPSGREYHTPKPFQPPSLDEATLTTMRAPPDPQPNSFEDDDESTEETTIDEDPIGAFPGTGKQYAGNTVYY